MARREEERLTPQAEARVAKRAAGTIKAIYPEVEADAVELAIQREIDREHDECIRYVVELRGYRSTALEEVFNNLCDGGLARVYTWNYGAEPPPKWEPDEE